MATEKPTKKRRIRSPHPGVVLMRPDPDLSVIILDAMEADEALPHDPYERDLTIYAFAAILNDSHSAPSIHARAVEVARRLGIDEALIAETEATFELRPCPTGIPLRPR